MNSIDFSATQPLRIFLFQIVSGLFLIYQIFNGSIFQWTMTASIYFLINIVGGTITYHRLLSHRAFTPKKWFQYLGPILGSMIGAGSTIAWVANHREHHQFADKERDPHSPIHQSWYRVQWGSMFHKPKIKYATELLRSPFHVALHQYYWLMHLGYALVLYSISPAAVIYAYLAPAALAWNLSSAVNVLNHYSFFGYRNFETPDRSVNNPITGLLVGGEGFHNNHHARPASFSFSQKWYEIDISAFLIKYFFSTKVRGGQA